MRRPFSLATRTFLLTFLAMCVVLVAGFFALNAALKARIKEGLKENLRSPSAGLTSKKSNITGSPPS